MPSRSAEGCSRGRCGGSRPPLAAAASRKAARCSSDGEGVRGSGDNSGWGSGGVKGGLRGGVRGGSDNVMNDTGRSLSPSCRLQLRQKQYTGGKEHVFRCLLGPQNAASFSRNTLITNLIVTTGAVKNPISKPIHISGNTMLKTCQSASVWGEGMHAQKGGGNMRHGRWRRQIGSENV